MKPSLSVKQYQWAIQGPCLYALWRAGRDRWTKQQQDFIDDRVKDIFDVDTSPRCEMNTKRGGPCEASAFTLGFRVQGGRVYALRCCAGAENHRYLRELP